MRIIEMRGENYCLRWMNTTWLTFGEIIILTLSILPGASQEMTENSPDLTIFLFQAHKRPVLKVKICQITGFIIFRIRDSEINLGSSVCDRKIVDTFVDTLLTHLVDTFVDTFVDTCC